jgi:oxygen-independent coproporphyrinogen-3 oxidase
VYVHVPFCRVHCPYCDFYTYPSARGRQDHFVAAVCQEIELCTTRLSPEGYQVETIYFGGGTPSLLTPHQFDIILTMLERMFACVSCPEITVEMNPGEVTAEFLAALKALGINRLSLGVQSFQESALRFLGRDCGQNAVLSALELVRAWGNWSADLIFGWAGQTIDSWSHDLELVLGYQPPHVSLYQLTIEQQTRFGSLARRGQTLLQTDDAQAELYILACTILKQNGLEQYEVSNFARPGHISRHNSAYWRRTEYLGLGPSAHSFLAGRRTENVRSLPRYIDLLNSRRSPLAAVEVLTPATARREQVWLGLRTSEGIPRQWLADTLYGLLEDAMAHGMVANRGDDRIVLTPKGMAVADAFAAQVLFTDS